VSTLSTLIKSSITNRLFFMVELNANLLQHINKLLQI